MKRILWFRRDLRTDDNPLLSLEGEVLPIFIFDTNILQKLDADDRRISFIFAQVIRLKKALQSKGLDLKLYLADPIKVFKQLATLGFDEVAASGDYDSYARQRDREVSHILPFNYMHDTYIFEPDGVMKNDRTPYLMFTPFYNKAKSLFGKEHLKTSLSAQQTRFDTDYTRIFKVDDTQENSFPIALGSLGFTSVDIQIGEPQTLLEHLNLSQYQKNREFPILEGTSGLGVHLRFGTISIREVLRFLARKRESGIDTEPFFRQLVFRDFYAYLLYHFPRIEHENYKYRFKGVANESTFNAFCTAKTGVPIIDAGINQLVKTGYMHNRVRMICASFFTKDLMLPWQWGEKFFARHLLDYDTASNTLSWQWSAGTGIDPQPYFRIFNPYLQAKKFDKEASYIKHWIPALRDIDPMLLHDEQKLFSYHLSDYPQPLIRHKEASQKALQYFKETLS